MVFQYILATTARDNFEATIQSFIILEDILEIIHIVVEHVVMQKFQRYDFKGMISTVKLKNSEKAFLKSESRTTVTFKL